MEDARIRAFSRSLGSKIRTLSLPLLIGAAIYALAPNAHATPNCQNLGAGDPMTTGNDTCQITSIPITPTPPVDALAGSDTLQLDATGTPFTFDTSTIGPVFVNFETVDVVGDSSSAVTLSGTASNSLAWNVDATGVLNVAGPDNIGDASSVNVDGVLHLTTDNETIGSLSGTGSVTLDVAGKALTTGGNNASTTFSGAIDGLGGLTKAGTGNFTLSGSNTYTGATIVNAGTLTVENAGAIANSSGVTVAANANLVGDTVAFSTQGMINHGFVSGDITINGNLSSDGTLSPGGVAGNPFGTMSVVGNYDSGTGAGHALMDVDFSAVLPTPGTTSDFIHVAGTAACCTFIDITATNAPTTGIKTTGNGIQLWQIDGASTSTGFALGHGIESGAYQYVLNYVTDYSGSLDGVFLKSALREEFYGNAAAMSGEQAIIRSCFRSDQRIPDSPRVRDNVRTWGEAEFATFKTTDTTGVRMDDKMSCATGGMDFGLGDGVRFGIVGGYGSSSIDVTTAGGIGSLDGSTNAIEGLFSIGTPEYFFNVTAGYASTDWTFDGPVAAAVDASQSGVIGSAQAGTTLNVTPFRFKFIAALNYDHTACSSNCILSGMTDDAGSMEAKGTVRIEAMTHQINPYVAVSFSNQLNHGNTVSYLGESLTSTASDNLLQLNAGFTAPVDEGFTVFGDFSVVDGTSNSTSGYTAAGGVKLYW